MAVTAAQTTTTKKVCNAQKEGHHCNISHTKDERQTCAVYKAVYHHFYPTSTSDQPFLGSVIYILILFLIISHYIGIWRKKGRKKSGREMVDFLVEAGNGAMTSSSHNTHTIVTRLYFSG